MKQRLVWLTVFVAGLLAIAIGAGMSPVIAQKTAGTAALTTSSGFHAEEVRVGSSCVVVVSRASSGTSDYLAAVPCR